MIYTIVSIKDRALNAYGRPIFVHTDGQAIRSFQDGINDTTTELNKHPEDYDLYLVGHFDDSTGTFQNIGLNGTQITNTPKQIAIGKQLKIQQE